MPVTPTYPGVYIEEIPSGVRTITGVATSITAFIGRALRGPVNEPVLIQSFADFDRRFGGIWTHSTMSYAVQHYFLNGGGQAIIVRVHRPSTAGATDLATLSLDADPDQGGGASLDLEAASPGTWGNELQTIVDFDTRDTSDTSLFNLTVQERVPNSDEIANSEQFLNISVDADSPRFITTVLEQQSNLIRVQGTAPDVRPDDSPLDGDGDPIPARFADADTGDDGLTIQDAQISNPDLEGDKEGIWALENADLFNLLCIPPLERTQDVGNATWTAALRYCKDRRAMLLVDPPSSWDSPDDVTNNATGVDSLGLRDENAAIYFPRIRMPDPRRENRLETFAPCGAVAGTFARTDATRGVWKAPAGQDATLAGVRQLTVKLTDGENGVLNPIGVNCLRTFPIVGHTVWGARTLEGADRLASEWKYVPVRRLALFLEESLYRGTQWVVFEPNDEPLRAQIRLNVGAFMQNLFRQGAFQGSTPREAYFVKCDSETTTQNDVNLGIVNILVGFAPLKPAEFVIVKIQQMAGQVEA